MKIIINEFITKNKGWTLQETIERSHLYEEIESHKYMMGVEPKSVYIIPMFMATSEKYEKSYYNNKHTMILSPC